MPGGSIQEKIRLQPNEINNRLVDSIEMPYFDKVKLKSKHYLKSTYLTFKTKIL
jgi:hypothetical protein